MLTNQSVRNDKPQVKGATSTQGVQETDKSNSTTPAKGLEERRLEDSKIKSSNLESSKSAIERAREELPGSKSRYDKGMELYKQGKVSIIGDGKFKVSGYYEVDTGKMQCECPDYKNNRRPCKHIFACLLLTKNRGKQRIEDLEGYNGNREKIVQCIAESQPKERGRTGTTAFQEARSKDFDRQAIITRLAVLNSATEILETHRKRIEFTDVVSIASQLEKWALGKD